MFWRRFLRKLSPHFSIITVSLAKGIRRILPTILTPVGTPIDCIDNQAGRVWSAPVGRSAFQPKNIVPGTSGNSRNLHGNSLCSSIPPFGKILKDTQKRKKLYT